MMILVQRAMAQISELRAQNDRILRALALAPEWAAYYARKNAELDAIIKTFPSAG